MPWVRRGCTYSRVKVCADYGHPAGSLSRPVPHAAPPRSTAARGNRDGLGPEVRRQSIARAIVGRPRQCPGHQLAPIGRRHKRSAITADCISQPSQIFDKNATEYRTAHHDAPRLRRSTSQCSLEQRKHAGGLDCVVGMQRRRVAAQLSQPVVIGPTVAAGDIGGARSREVGTMAGGRIRALQPRMRH